MSSFSSGLDQGVHIRVVSRNIRHCRCYSFLYGNSEAHLLLGAPRDISLQNFYFGYFIGRIIIQWCIFSSFLLNRGGICSGWLNKSVYVFPLLINCAFIFISPRRNLDSRVIKQYKCEWNVMDLNVSYCCFNPKFIHNTMFTYLYSSTVLSQDVISQNGGKVPNISIR